MHFRKLMRMNSQLARAAFRDPPKPLSEGEFESAKRALLEDGKLRVEELGAQHRHQTLAEFMVDVVFEEDEGNAEDVAATEASAEPAAQAEAKREQEPRAEAETPAAADAAEAHATATPRAVAAAADALRAAEADADEKEKEEEEEEGDVTFGVHELEAPAVGAPLPSEEEIMQEEERYREARESLIEDPFYVCDLSVVARKHREWLALFPAITPHYAIKCNPDPGVVKTLALLGAGFDCASKAEIQLALSQGATPERIVYANPCKALPELRFAKEAGVRMMTFDNAEELHKLKDHYAESELLLRIRINDAHSAVPLGKKFGAELKDCERLIKLARKLGLKLVGVSFHVGSGCYDADAYPNAIRAAKTVFNLYHKLTGEQLHTLDIGGGFPGSTKEKVSIEFIAQRVNAVIEELFQGVRVISEPGRFYVEESHALCVEIVAVQDTETMFSGPDSAFSPGPSPFSAGRHLGPGASPKRAAQPSPLAKPAGAKPALNGAPSMEPLPAASAQSEQEIRFVYFINEGVYGSFKDRVLLEETFTPYVLYSKRISEYLARKEQQRRALAAEEAARNAVVPASDGAAATATATATAAGATGADARRGAAVSRFSKVLAGGIATPSDAAAADGAAGAPRPASPELGGSASLSSIASEASDAATTLRDLAELPLYPSRICGPSNHRLDVVTAMVRLPELAVGDWLYFTRMGAYTLSLASCYHGRAKPLSRYVWLDENAVYRGPAAAAAAASASAAAAVSPAAAAPAPAAAANPAPAEAAAAAAAASAQPPSPDEAKSLSPSGSHGDIRMASTLLEAVMAGGAEPAGDDSALRTVARTVHARRVRRKRKKSLGADEPLEGVEEEGENEEH